MLTFIGFTFREALNRKVLLISLVMAVVFLGLFGTGVFFAVRDVERAGNQMMALVLYPQLLLLGLYFGGFIVSFLAIFSSAGLISADVESGAIHSIIPKPIRRSDIVLGKFFGQAIFLALYAVLLFSCIYAIVTILTGISLDRGINAALLFCLQPLVLLAVTIMLSAVTGTVVSGTITFMLYVLALIGGVIEWMGWIVGSLSLKNAGIIASLILPVDALYRKMTHILMAPSSLQQQMGTLGSVNMMGPFGSVNEPSVWMVVYTIIYVAVFVTLAAYSFEKKDI